MRQIPDTPLRVRTDSSATLFISTREEDDGGELVVEDTYGPPRCSRVRLGLIRVAPRVRSPPLGSRSKPRVTRH